jgi:hypothetical protein
VRNSWGERKFAPLSEIAQSGHAHEQGLRMAWGSEEKAMSKIALFGATGMIGQRILNERYRADAAA